MTSMRKQTNSGALAGHGNGVIPTRTAPGEPSEDATEALAHVVVAADLAEQGRIAVTCTGDMSRKEFLARLMAGRSK
ncbi:hypothetical protein [Azospirillum sp. SYSU D00513]|uniref:hypothetical protein n=1 Tax=Azospirillum sp. SYSU D00513 TaxID=2812561 RepID=UPI001A95F8C5|nr:hypothetical protein [Azospirillum sp. SYSU D00513]